MRKVLPGQQLFWNSDLPSFSSSFCSISDFLYGKNISTFVFGSGSSELTWFTLQNAYLQRCQLNLIMSYFTRAFLDGSKIFFSRSRRLRREKRREKTRTRARFVKFLGQASVSLAFFFLFSNQVLACNFQNNSLEPTIQEKSSFLVLLKKIAFCMIGLLALGAVSYVLSSRTVPYFIKLAPSLNKNIGSPVLDILPIAVVNTLPTGIDLIGISNKVSNKVRESLRVPYFLNSPFSSELSTLPQRIFEAIEFLGKVEADPLFSLKKYKNESYNIISLMARHIDSLTALVGENKEQLGLHSGKIILLNEAYNRVCSNNVKTCIRVLLLKAK